MRRGKTLGGQHRPAKREWKHENGMLPLDHLQSDAQVVEDGHPEILTDGGGSIPNWEASLPAVGVSLFTNQRHKAAPLEIVNDRLATLLTHQLQQLSVRRANGNDHLPAFAQLLE